MAGDGYDINIDVDFDDAKARQELRQLVQHTRRQTAILENLTHITANLDTKAYRSQMSRLASEKVAPKEVKLTADAKAATGRLEQLRAEIEATRGDVNVGADGSRALRESQSIRQVVEGVRGDINVGADTSRALRETALAKQAIDSTRANINVGANTAMATGQLLSFTRGIEQTVGRLGSIALLSGGAGLALGAVGAGIGGFGLATAASMDQARWAFENLMGSAEAAAPVLDQLKRSALNTPFDLNDVISLAFRLKAAGRSVQGLAGDAETLADALAATGGGAQQLEGALFQIQQLQGRSKILEREDLRTLNNQLPGFMGTFNRLFGDKREFGTPEKAMDAVFQAIAAIPGAAGAAARATEETFMGRFNKFKDNIQINFAEAFMPQKPVLFAGLDAISDALDVFLRDFAPVGAETLGKLGPIFADLLVAATPLIVLFTEAFPKVLAGFVPVVEKVSDAFVRWGVSADGLAEIITKLIVGGALIKFGAMFSGLVTPILTVATSIGPVITGFKSVASVGAGLIATFKGGFSIATIAGMGFFKALAVGAIAVLAPFAKFIAIAAAVVLVVISFVNAFRQSKDSINVLKGVVSDLWKQMKPGVDLIKSGLTSAIRGLTAYFEAMIPITVALWRLIANTQIFKVLGFAIGGVVKILGSLIETIFSAIGAIGRLVKRIPFIGKLFKESSKDSKEAVDEAKESVVDFGDKTVEAAQKAQQAFDEIKTSVMGLVSQPLTLQTDTKFSDAGSALSKSRKDVESQLKDIDLLTKRNFSEIVVEASKMGGESGASFIADAANAVRSGRTEVAQSIVDNLRLNAAMQAKIEAAAIEVANTHQEALVKAQEKARRDSMIKKLLDRAGIFARYTVGITDGDQLRQVRSGLEKQLQGMSTDEIVAFAARSNITFDTPTSLKKSVIPGIENDAKAIAEEASSITTEAFQTAFAKVDLTSAVSSAFSNFGSMISQHIQYGSEIDARLNSLVKTMALLLRIKIYSSFLSSNPFEPIALSLKNTVDEAGRSLRGFLTGLSIYSLLYYGASKKIGASISKGIIDGINSSSIGDTIANAVYRKIAQSYNSIARQIESAYRVARLAFSMMPGGGGFFNAMLSPGLRLPRLASGTNFAQGGLTLVGEHGPELVQLPRGSKVYPAISTERMLSNTTNNAGDTYNTTINGVSFEDAVARFEERVRNKNRRFV